MDFWNIFGISAINDYSWSMSFLFMYCYCPNEMCNHFSMHKITHFCHLWFLHFYSFTIPSKEPIFWWMHHSQNVYTTRDKFAQVHQRNGMRKEERGITTVGFEKICNGIESKRREIIVLWIYSLVWSLNKRISFWLFINISGKNWFYTLARQSETNA